jgi:hypothetical protein
VRLAAALVWLGGLTAMTLTPGRAPVAGMVSVCVLCGPRGSADAILNVILFVPLGLLVGTRRGPIAALLVGVLVSGAVEAVQLPLDGRYSNLGDLVWNGLGAFLGAASVPWLRLWLGGGSPWIGGVVAVGLPALWLGGAGLLLEPVGSTGPYSVAAPESVEARIANQGDGAWSVTAQAPRPRTSHDLQPIVRILDVDGTVVAVLGDDRRDLVLRERTWAPIARFDQASHRLHGALRHVPEGRPVGVSASRAAGGAVCLGTAVQERCGVGVAPSRTWTLLRAREHASERLKLRVDTAWAATLTLLVGLLGGGPVGTLLTAGALGAAAALAAAATPLVAPGWSGALGLVLGVAAGVVLRPLARIFLEAARG